MTVIHPTAIIDKRAEIGEDVTIGPYVVIEGPVRLCDRVWIGAQAYVTGHTLVGEDCAIHPFAAIGGTPQDYAYHGERSYCRIGPRTVMREGATVHRGTTPESTTTVGADGLLMAYSHVAHNCDVADHVTLTNATALAGHVSVGPYAVFGGSAVVHQFVRVGEHVMVGGATVLTQDALPFMMYVKRNSCAGLNRVGLRRHGFTADEINELKMLHRKLIREGTNIRQIAAATASEVKTDPGRRFVDFILAPSRRGLAHQQ